MVEVVIKGGAGRREEVRHLTKRVNCLKREEVNK